MPSSTIHVKQYDTAPPASTTLEVGGTAVDIENATIQFHLKDRAGNIIVDAAANNDQVGDGSDGTLGMVSYDWADGDTDDPISGGRAEWEVTFIDGTVRRFPTKGYQPCYIWGAVIE